MLQEMNNSIVELTTTVPNLNCNTSIPYLQYWNNYPVYIYQDKTKKAIEILKFLQNDKLIKCDSVPKFIELVEKISVLL